MENINSTEISMDDYRKIESRIDSIMSEEELIKTHQELLGKSCKNDYTEIKDCGVEFIRKFLSRDWGRSIVYQYSQGAEKFIQSKYLSDYFKTSISVLLSDENLSDEVTNALNSDKKINDMSEEEIMMIYSSIKKFYAKAKRTEKVNVASCFMSFLYKLDGKGVSTFIKNNINNYDLVSHILLTSGLNDRASYYSGRGVNYSDLNEKNLVAIFNKLLKIDIDYAINFVEMVCQMKTLGATEFINSFENLATNGFKFQTLDIDDSNVSLDGVYGEARDTIAMISLFSIMGKRNDDYQISASNQMKSSFISKINPILQKINPDYCKSDIHTSGSGYYNDSYDKYYYKIKKL